MHNTQHHYQAVKHDIANMVYLFNGINANYEYDLCIA